MRYVGVYEGLWRPHEGRGHLEEGRHAIAMSQDQPTGKAARPMSPASSREGRRPKPEWAEGLRHLYDSVLNEPLPDSFADLISKLDESGK